MPATSNASLCKERSRLHALLQVLNGRSDARKEAMPCQTSGCQSGRIHFLGPTQTFNMLHNIWVLTLLRQAGTDDTRTVRFSAAQTAGLCCLKVVTKNAYVRLMTSPMPKHT